MIKIEQVKISRYRSINEITLEFDNNNNIVAICGPNNVGKTNLLRAIDLFFYPNKYDYKLDVPYFKQANEFGGGSVYTLITIILYDDINNIRYNLTRDFKSINHSYSLKKCFSIKNNLKTALTENDVNSIVSKVNVIFVESIDDIVRDTIKDIANEVLDVKFDNSRFSDSRKKLKESYDEYIDGMQDILNQFASKISGTFTMFNPNWTIDFRVPKNSNTFKDLITKDVIFDLYDQGAKGIINKGAGLQRLAVILLQFEAIKRMKKTNSIILIDEPDLYIHAGLQIKLRDFMRNVSHDYQIIYTTHSPVFIDTFKMSNVFLIELKNDTKSVKGEEVQVYLTKNVDLAKEEGYQRICDHLGIIRDVAEPLYDFNILVEGESDRDYIEELSKYFGLQAINIISANGVTNISKWLEFYNSFYKGIDGRKPIIKVIFDNDIAGRDNYKKVKEESFKYIVVKKCLLNNCFGDSNASFEKNNTNNEIEDFIYPEIMSFLINKLLQKKCLNKINESAIVKKISKSAFKSSGILSLLENAKNESNPDNGNCLTFTSSDYSKESIKKSLSNMFKIELNSKIINIIHSVKDNYPHVETFIRELYKFD